MLSRTPRMDQFDLSFPKQFFNSAIIAKYDKYVQWREGHLEDMLSVVNESIQTVTLPVFATPTYQTSLMKSTATATSGIENEGKGGTFDIIANRAFVVTFRLIDAYLNYFLFIEQLNYINIPTNEAVFPILPIMVFDGSNHVAVKFTPKDVLMTAVGQLQLSKNRYGREFTTFDVEFTYKDFSLEITPPQPTEQT